MAGACRRLCPFGANATFQAGAVCSAVNAKTSTLTHGQETVSAVVLSSTEAFHAAADSASCPACRVEGQQV